MEPIVVKGSHFFTSESSNPFLIRGINYWYDGASSLNMSIATIPQLEDGLACRRDIPYLTSLGINTILVDNIRPSTNGENSACMEQLQKAGIYTLVGIGSLSLTIQSRQAWDSELMQRFTAVVDSFVRYDNVLGFYVTGSAITVPFVRGAVRDLKKYVRSKGRAIPIGYLGKLRGKDLSNVLNCGDQQSSIDFLALDLAGNCDNPSYAVLMTEKAVADHIGYTVPTFLYSPQCNPRTVANPRVFDFLSQPNITKVMSGAVVFSYFNYLRYDEFPGLMDITRGEVSPAPGFEIVSSVYSSMRPATTDLYTPTITSHPSICSSILTISHSAESESTPKDYEVKVATNLPPSPDSRTCQCMMDSLDCVANHTYKPPVESISPDMFTPTIVFEDEKQLMDSICSKNNSLCLGSKRDTVNGSYGAFSVCNSTERGSWILNRLHKSSNGDATACSSAGGILRETGSARSLSNACKDVMKQAGPLGTGSVTPTLAFDGQNNPGYGSSLSQEAKAGIGVGVAVFLAFLSAAIFLGLRRRKMKNIKQESSPGVQGSDGDVFGKAELPATTVDSPNKILWKAEVGGEDVNEMDGGPKLKEVGVDGEMTELPGSENKPVELNADGEMVELPGSENKPMELNATEELFELPNNEHMPAELDANSNKPVVYERKAG